VITPSGTQTYAAAAAITVTFQCVLPHIVDGIGVAPTPAMIVSTSLGYVSFTATKVGTLH
jgi:hypothetical protein